MQLVKKANDLIEAKYNLSKNEQRLVLYLVSTIKKEDSDFKNYEFTFDEISKLTDISKTRVYEELSNIAENLLKKPICFFDESKKFYCNWCSGFEINNSTLECKIRFDPGLKKYLLQLKECFTAYEFKNITGFESRYSFRFYEICKQYEKLKTRKISIYDLKNFLGIENKYEKISDLKRFVIEPSLVDINTHSDLYVSVIYVKRRRTIVAVEFIIESKDIIEPPGKRGDQKNSLPVSSLEELSANAAKTVKAKKAWAKLGPEEKAKYHPESETIGFIKFRSGFVDE